MRGFSMTDPGEKWRDQVFQWPGRLTHGEIVFDAGDSENERECWLLSTGKFQLNPELCMPGSHVLRFVEKLE